MPRKNPSTNDVEHCPCCGQIIPPRLVFENKPVRQRIYDYIAAHPEGVSRDQILRHVYADDIDGGPESHAAVSANLNRMKAELAARGLAIRSSFGDGAVYRLVSLVREAAE